MHTVRVAAAAAAALLLSACAAGEDPTVGAAPTAAPASAAASPVPAALPSPAPSADVRTIDVTVAAGKVTGTTGREAVALGEQVVLRFTSDVAEQIHVHGYDLYVDLVPGTPAEVPLTATIPGGFEVELHGTGQVLYQLRVS